MPYFDVIVSMKDVKHGIKRKLFLRLETMTVKTNDFARYIPSVGMAPVSVVVTSAVEDGEILVRCIGHIGKGECGSQEFPVYSDELLEF